MEAKPWYHSQGVWANLITMVVGLGSSFGLLNSTTGAMIMAEGPALIVAGVVVVTGIWGLYGRLSATTTLTTKAAATVAANK